MTPAFIVQLALTVFFLWLCFFSGMVSGFVQGFIVAVVLMHWFGGRLAK